MLKDFGFFSRWWTQHTTGAGIQSGALLLLVADS